MLRRIEELLARRRAPIWLGLFAIAMCAPALPFGLQADDVAFAYRVQRGVAPWALFDLSADNSFRALREIGALTWWSNPAVEARFLRPLSSLSHALEFRVWPYAPWLMRLFNALLYGSCVTLAALLYRRLSVASATAALASLLFVLDDGHAASATWISSRNTLLALTFSLLALWLHMRSREPHRLGLRAASAGAVCLALLSAEAGLWSVALLASFALCYEAGPIQQRLKSVAAPLLLSALWLTGYVALGYGFRGGSLYRDLSSPGTVLAQGLMDLPVWFAAQFGPGVGTLPFFTPLARVRALFFPVAALLLWLLLPSLRRSRECRFFALAFALSVVPLLGTIPSVRVLLGPSFGAMGWIACSIAEGRTSASRRERWGARLMLVCHLWIAGLLFVPTLRHALEPVAYGTRALKNAIQTRQQVVLVASPFEMLGNYALAANAVDPRVEAPRGLHTLYGGSSSLWAERIDERTLDVEPEHGWGHTVFERIFCAPEAMPGASAKIETPAFTAHVLTTNASGMPQRVRFVFSTPLESPSRQWLTWNGNRPLQWTPPAVGTGVRLAPTPFVASLTP